eukprot:8504466-Pyramimonas_sp.AAC.1
MKHRSKKVITRRGVDALLQQFPEVIRAQKLLDMQRAEAGQIGKPYLYASWLCVVSTARWGISPRWCRAR